jgi:hypothetical protein
MVLTILHDSEKIIIESEEIYDIIRPLKRGNESHYHHNNTSQLNIFNFIQKRVDSNGWDGLILKAPKFIIKD